MSKTQDLSQRLIVQWPDHTRQAEREASFTGGKLVVHLTVTYKVAKAPVHCRFHSSREFSKIEQV